MKNYRLKRWAVSAVMISMLGATSAWAKPDGAPNEDRMKPEQRLEMMRKHLNLTDEQTQKVRVIMEKYEPKRQELMKKLPPLRKELFTLMSQPTPDRAQVKAKMQQIDAIQLELRLLMLDGRTETFQVLNEEQKAKWMQHMREFAKNRSKKGKDRD